MIARRNFSIASEGSETKLSEFCNSTKLEISFQIQNMELLPKALFKDR